MAWDNKTFNVNYKWDIDTIGRSLTADADYARFNFNAPADQSSKYYGALNADLNKEASLTSTILKYN
jgi:hypothetical protein